MPINPANATRGNAAAAEPSRDAASSAAAASEESSSPRTPGVSRVRRRTRRRVRRRPRRDRGFGRGRVRIPRERRLLRHLRLRASGLRRRRGARLGRRDPGRRAARRAPRARDVASHPRAGDAASAENIPPRVVDHPAEAATRDRRRDARGPDAAATAAATAERSVCDDMPLGPRGPLGRREEGYFHDRTTTPADPPARAPSRSATASNATSPLRASSARARVESDDRARTPGTRAKLCPPSPRAPRGAGEDRPSRVSSSSPPQKT